jgi:outer membrane receptor protein involved in Fe transport
VNTDYTPSYFTSEEQYQARINQELGAVNLQLTGFYHKAKVDSQQDYNLSVQNRAGFAAGLGTLQAAAAGLVPGLPAAFFTGFANAVIPNGAAGNLCTSLSEESGTGSFSGKKLCSATPQDFDRSNSYSKDWSVEGIATTDFDGPFNFLLGGIYVDSKLSENSYYVNSFGIDYLTGILGSFTSLGAGAPASYLGTPFYRNNSDFLNVKSYGLFGEGYYEFSDAVKLTVGLRYNNDKKTVRARTSLANFLVPYTSTDAFSSPFVGSFDADPGTAGNQLWQDRSVGFNKMTGRAVLDWKVSEDNLIYASYSRGYKSGGINPPLSPIFTVPEAFAPEKVDAFEIGSKNVFANGAFTFNATAFYYKYAGLQLSRIVARTSVNDNIDATIYGLELESIIRPSRNVAINMGASYLKTKAGDSGSRLTNPRDPSGGREDAVIIKDITNGSNCAVVSNSGSVAGVNGFVTAINAGVGLRAPTSFGANSGVKANGAFGVCSVLTAQAAGAAGAAGSANLPPPALAM